MVLQDISEEFVTDIAIPIKPQSIGIGPGMGQEQETQMALYRFLSDNKVPLVVDADALNILSQDKSWLKMLPVNSILTPHRKELERLLGTFSSEEELLENIMQTARKYELVIVNKGSPTLITDGINIYQNTTGNAALATAGSGDVLTGIITGLAAQGFSGIDAAIIGVFVHGLTADIAVMDSSPRSFIASDIISNLGKAFRVLER